jgi:hypothetical protein
LLGKSGSHIRDIGIGKLLEHFHIPFGIAIYQVMTLSPIDIAIGLLASKLGLPKLVVLLVISFVA